jgi:hypothetical protein
MQFEGGFGYSRRPSRQPSGREAAAKLRQGGGWGWYPVTWEKLQSGMFYPVERRPQRRRSRRLESRRYPPLPCLLSLLNFAVASLATDLQFIETGSKTG